MLAQKPNFLFVIVDDLGWRDLSCYGSDFYETPNLDKLAQEGMKFTNAYTAAPVCTPTRASILTGKYPATLGVTNVGNADGTLEQAKGKLLDVSYIDHLPSGELSLARALKNEGYTTWHVGKWHLGQEPYYPERCGFDINIGGCHWGMPFYGYFSPYNIPTLENGPDGEYLTDRLTDEAINLIKNNKGKPFFLYLSYYSVHVPIQAKKEDIIKFKKKADAMGLSKMKAFELGEQFPCEHLRHIRVERRLIQSDPVYAAMIYNLDKNLGRIMKTINESGEANNTIIIFTSDNGGLATAEDSPTCNFPLRDGKGWMYEGGVRVPLIIKWPKITRFNSICDLPVTSPDFYPTILNMANLSLIPEQHKDGLSLVPLLKDNKKINREMIFWHYPHYGNQGGKPASSIRKGDYKLIEFFEDNHLELYNLKEDIKEINNLVSIKQKEAKEMKELLYKWRNQINVKIPEHNPDFIPWLSKYY